MEECSSSGNFARADEQSMRDTGTTFYASGIGNIQTPFMKQCKLSDHELIYCWFDCVFPVECAERLRQRIQPYVILACVYVWRARFFFLSKYWYNGSHKTAQFPQLLACQLKAEWCARVATSPPTRNSAWRWRRQYGAAPFRSEWSDVCMLSW